MSKIQTDLIPLKDAEAVHAELDSLDGLNTSASIAKLTRIIEGFANGEMQRRGRDKIYELHRQGMSGVEIAKQLGISPSAVSQCLTTIQEKTGFLTAFVAIRKLLNEHSRMTLTEIYEHLPELPESTIKSALRRGVRAGQFSQPRRGVYAKVSN